ncbi:MAG: c-type cytochrome [Pseudorhodoplanes sp.]|nr:MAG: c-type cytochrome [Pseudorhodoplanes sp.]
MKTLLGLVTAALTAGAALAADPAALLMRSGRMSAAALLAAPPLDPSHPAWSKAAPTLLLAYPQQMIAPGLENGAPIPVEMRALASRTHLAVKLTWPDQTRDQYRTDATDTFPDAVAVQFTRLEQSLPYIGMGEKDRPVSMWFWRHGRKPEFLVARGFGTLGPGRGRAPQARSVWHEGRWSVVLLGSLPVERNPLPLAIAIWDGRAQARDGRKHLSAWHLLRLPDRTQHRRALTALLGEAVATGDRGRGRSLVEEHGCAGCHRLPGGEVVDHGPDLSFAGGVHWPGYLRRSIANPSGFIVPLERYRDSAGHDRELSLMPKANLRNRDVDDLVAYLASLR